MQQHIGYKILTSVVICVLLAMGGVAIYATHQQERSILAQNERTIHSLTESTATSVETIMLAGYADIAQSLADNLKTLPDVVDFRIVHRDGYEAFRKNNTIDEVNERIGDEEFFPREQEQHIELLDAASGPLRTLLDSREIVSYYERSADQEELLTVLAPIPNQKDCHRCHGADHEVRGIVKLSTSIAPVRQEIRETWIGLLITIGVVTLLVSLAIGFVVRRISMPIMAVADEMEEIATGRGDLSAQLPVRGRDEVAKLSAGFNSFVGKIHQAVTEVAGASRSLGSLAEQVSAISSDTKRATEAQQSETVAVREAIRTVAGSMESVNEHTAAAMGQAREVDQLTHRGQAEVEATIQELRNLMTKIQGAESAVTSLTEGVEDISTVTSLIENIADQTNLLALNASIEAARAGEQGRGFAVVADEVRHLATKTRASTGDIRRFVERLQTESSSVCQQINESLEQADISVEQADNSGKLLHQITDAAHQISELNTAIAKTMAESASSIDSINEAVEGIAAESSTTSQQAEAVSQRSNELAEQVDRLEQLVKRFHL